MDTNYNKGRQTGWGWGVATPPPPLNFERGLNDCQPPDFERIFFNCSLLLLCTGYFYKGGSLPLN